MVLPDISALDQLENSDLRALFEFLFKRPAPPRSGRSFLTINIAWEIQARQHGGLTPKLKRRLESLAKKFDKDPDYDPFDRPLIKPGTRLVREWKGQPHVVTATEHGFEYNGQNYKHLSVIARQITGTQWSGPAFFGLKPKRRATS